MIKIHTEKAPAAVGPYSQAIVSNGMVYTSGQIAIDPATNTIKAVTIQEQTEQIMKNLAEVLETAGSSFEKAVKTTCFLDDIRQVLHITSGKKLRCSKDSPQGSSR